jgi:deoxyribose-phosphate aldolase
MAIDPKDVERIVEIVTREVLLALAEQEQLKKMPHCEHCIGECQEGICVKTCFDHIGHVIDAGAERITSTLGGIPQNLNVAALIDHTLLKPDATPDQIAQLCHEARKYGFASVCINPGHVKLCTDLLRNSNVKVCTVIGFPLGATSPESKVYETETALRDGATEIDMVVNIGALKGGDHTWVARDIQGVVETAHNGGAIVKVIIETSLLTNEEKVKACLLAKQAGADYVLQSKMWLLCAVLSDRKWASKPPAACTPSRMPGAWFRPARPALAPAQASR